MGEESNEKWEKLRSLLEERGNWPEVYLFKFIVKNESDKINEVKSLFTDAEIDLKYSKNGNYVSVSVKEMMMNPDRVIEKYKQVGKIDGVLSL